MYVIQPVPDIFTPLIPYLVFYQDWKSYVSIEN